MISLNKSYNSHVKLEQEKTSLLWRDKLKQYVNNFNCFYTVFEVENYCHMS